MRQRNSGAMMRQDMSWGEEARAQLAAASRKRGDAYLKYWAAWAKHDPTSPRLARSGIVYVGRYDEPEKLKHRPEAVGVWLDDLAGAVERLVLAMPPPEHEVVMAYYRRIWIRPESNTELQEHIRAWTVEAIIDELNRLRRRSHMGLQEIPRRTFFDRLERARCRIESGAEQEQWLDAPDI